MYRKVKGITQRLFRKTVMRYPKKVGVRRWHNWGKYLKKLREEEEKIEEVEFEGGEEIETYEDYAEAESP